MFLLAHGAASLLSLPGDDVAQPKSQKFSGNFYDIDQAE
jgi:hypothetical protein